VVFYFDTLMRVEERLKSFIDKILLVIGKGDISVAGVNSSISQIAFALRREVAALARLITKNDPGHPEITKKVQDIEGYLQTLQALGEISPQRCNDLIDELQDIIKP
jgi:hypothetical protein